MHFIAVARDALSAVPKLSPTVMSLPQAVQDDDIVPESAFRLYGDHVGDGEGQVRQVLGDIGRDDGGDRGLSSDLAPTSIFTAERM